MTDPAAQPVNPSPVPTSYNVQPVQALGDDGTPSAWLVMLSDASPTGTHHVFLAPDEAVGYAQRILAVAEFARNGGQLKPGPAKPTIVKPKLIVPPGLRR